MRPPLMSGASWQEGAGGGMLVDGLQDGGRVNNTQLIALFPSSWRKKKKERNIVTSSERPAKLRALRLDNSSWTTVISDHHQKNVSNKTWCYLSNYLSISAPNVRLNQLKRHNMINKNFKNFPFT